MSGENRQPRGGSLPEDAKPGVEQGGVPAGKVLLAAGAILGLLLFGLLFAGGLFLWLEADREPIGHTKLETTELTPPPPELEASPQGDRMAIEARAKAMLDDYAWTDQAAGRVRIPIGQAMERVAETGWPDPPRQAAK